MSESEKPPGNQDGTTGLGGVDATGPALPAGETEPPTRSSRKTPPPLPGFALQPSLPPQSALPSLSLPPPPPRSAAKTVAYIVLVVVLIAVAIVAGRRVGGRGRAPEAAAPAITTAGVPAPSAADSVLMVPTIEMK